MKKIVLFLLLISSINCIAAPFNGEIQQFKQPDGSYVDVKLFGTEYYMRGEGLDNYTVIRDENTQWICYAKLSDDGNELISSGIIYHGVQGDNNSLRTDLDLSLHLDISDAARSAVIASKKKQLEGKNKKSTPSAGSATGINNMTPIRHVLGNIKGLCIVVDFPDEPGTLPISEFEDLCNDLNYTNFGNNGSLRAFYTDVSGGLLDYENVVFGYFHCQKTFAHYDSLPHGQGAQEILGMALHWLDSQGFDFSTLSTNADGSITAINLIRTGSAKAWAKGMWNHQGGYGGFAADGVRSGAYNTSGASAPLSIGTLAHENGHMLFDWPDLYKYSTNTGVDGIRGFDLMSGYIGQNPAPPNPLFRSNAGWGKVIDVTDYNGLNYDLANSGICYIYKNINDTNEFFLLENRMKTGRNTHIPDEGLTIWHIDRNGDNQTMHNEVYLMHANNDEIDCSGACYHAGIHDYFSSASSPASNWYNGDPSGLKVWDIDSVQNILKYKLGAGQAAPKLKIEYINLTNDDNNDGYIEAGESANVLVSGINIGQLNADTVTITCINAGDTAGYVTINTAPVSIGVLNVLQTVPVTFNFSVSANTPLATNIKLKFLISDGTDSTYITKVILIGKLVSMSNEESITCGLIFFDEGGAQANYTDNSDFVKTFIPATAGKKLKAEFTFFEVEYEKNCIFDYLNIYDGPGTSSTLINRYCGDSLPGVILSSHPSGALTFEFHSDDSYGKKGWRALVTCETSTGIDDDKQADYFEIYPNPSTGLLNIKLNSNAAMELTVTDLIGNVLLKINTGNKQTLAVDFSENANGMYFVHFKNNKTVYTQKVIINR